MKLQTKLSLALLAGLLTVYLGSSVFQYRHNSSAVGKFSRELCAAEEDDHWGWVERLQLATSAPLIDAMAEGEMDKFEKILASQRQVPGLQELSLFDAAGRTVYSSDPARLKQKLPDDLKGQLLGSAQVLKRRTEESFEMYRSVPVTKACIECHDAWKENEISGVMSMKFSTEALKAAERSWVDFEHNLNRTSAATSLWTAGVLVIALGTLVGLVIHFQLTRPLKKVVEILNVEATQVGQVVAQLSVQSQSLAEGASEQAASLEETSASLEEISSMTRRNAQNVQSAKDFTAQTRATAESGAQSTHEMGQAMHGIRTASGEMRDAMNGIKTASNDVSKIIKTIDEIAFQTNILALNAAVEAARAGEAGMGFAVVADEVRNLAQRSAKAAKETADMIETSIKRSDDGVRVTDKVVASVEEVAAKSQELEAKLAEIVAKAQKVDEQVAQIASASDEQSQGISEVNMAVSQMDKVTQSNAANAEESAAAAEELNAQAEVLKDAVRELQQLVGGNPKEVATSPQAKAVVAPTYHSKPSPTKARPKSSGTPKASPSSVSRSNDLDFPVPEPIGAAHAKSGGKDF